MNKLNISEGSKIDCPYCGHLVYDGEYTFSHCQHTVYIASDDGFEYLAANISLDINNNDYKSSIDIITDALTAKPFGISIKYILESIEGPNGYIGFENNTFGRLTVSFTNKYTENDVRKFAESVQNELKVVIDVVPGFDNDWMAIFDVVIRSLPFDDINDVLQIYLDKYDMKAERINFPRETRGPLIKPSSRQ